MLNPELAKSIEQNTISHAYLFLDEDAAYEFAKALKPKAVDFIIQEDLLTKDIEALQEELKLKPYGERRVVLIKAADNMQVLVQNKLLKTLEEPLGNTVIILSAQRRDALLPTILSRCTEIAGFDKEFSFSKDALNLAKEFIKLEAVFYKRKKLLSSIEDKDPAIDFLNALENLYRQDLIESLDSDRLGKKIKLTEEIRNNIKNGYSVSYSLKALALNI